MGYTKKLGVFFSFLCVVVCTYTSCAQPFGTKNPKRQDTLRGTITPQRAWWNVLKYNLTVAPDYNTRSIKGRNIITFYDSGGYTMQIDLQQPMEIDSILFDGVPVKHKREENVLWVYLRDSARRYKIAPGAKDLSIYFHGVPRPALRAPWDGGWIWQKDAKGRPWMSVAVQGLGASAWYPCKDHQSDEPDSGAVFTVQVPDTLVAVANGKLKNKTASNGTASYTWEVTSPINNYNIVPYIGKYVNWSETFRGEKGDLTCSYWVLDYNLQKAQKQFQQVKPTLQSMEYWFGPYPFYKDDYKLVEAPHLGMEHQSAVAYGNIYTNGYLGSDLSGSGWGLKWDFIIVHETGHEWFGNNITTKDIADMWVHEGFTNYSETLFTEKWYGNEAGNEYLQGIRKNIENDKPIIGSYGFNQEGSGDMYYKGAYLLHTVRQVIDNDEQFRSILRGLNQQFYHQTVTTKQVEEYISQKSKKDFSKVFDQYLRTTTIPTLDYRINGNKLSYRWVDVVPGFSMPVKVALSKDPKPWIWIQPKSNEWKTLPSSAAYTGTFDIDKNFYVRVKKVSSE